MDTDEIKAILAHCRKIVALFHASHIYRAKLKKMIKDMGLDDLKHVNDVVTRWGSKQKMLQRVKYLLPATDRIFLDDRKYQDLTVDRYENKLIDSIFHALNGFQKLTDILAADKDVTASSFISLLRFIYELTSADEEDTTYLSYSGKT